MPPLVVLWLAFAVMGGAVFLPQHAGLDADRDAESSQEAGLGLCAATAAVLFVAIARRPRRPASSLKREPPTPSPRVVVRPAKGVATLPPYASLRSALQAFLI